MGRTTLIIDDNILSRVRKLASQSGRTLREQVQMLLLEGMRSRGLKTKSTYKFDPPLVAGELKAGVDIADRKSLFDLMD